MKEEDKAREFEKWRNNVYKIVCTRSYEFEGKEFKKGDISYHCRGRLIPDDWKKSDQQ